MRHPRARASAGSPCSAPRWPVRPAALALTAGLLTPLLPLAVAAPAAAADGALPGYEVTILATKTSVFDGSYAEAIGSQGHVVGQNVAYEKPSQAWVWQRGAFTVRGTISQQEAVNGKGDAVGFARHNEEMYGYTNQAYAFTGGSGHWLAPLPEYLEGDSRAHDINDSGVAVGDAQGGAERPHPTVAVEWDASGAVQRLPELPAQTYGSALAVNNSGTVLGIVQSEGYDGTVLWENGTVRQLPDVTGPVSINDSGTVIGYVDAGDVQGAARYRDGKAEALQGQYVVPRAINAAGDVTGYADGEAVVYPAGSGTPVVLDQTTGNADLDLVDANGIADDGSILAIGYLNGAGVSVLLTPKALPPTLSAVALEQPAVPSGEWVPVPDAGTIDGNKVRLRTTVANREGVAKDVRIVITHGTEVLTPTPLSATVPARGSVDVPLTWDSTGSAWEDGKAAAPEEFTIELFSDGQQIGEKKVSLVVRPRPVVLVHGFNADASTWDAYPGIVHAVRPDWPVYAVGDGQAPGAMDTGSLASPTRIPNTIVDNAGVMAGYVEGVRDQLDAQDVDIVAHSMGGLISRQYIESYMPRDADGDNVATRLIMLGTPNQGSRCAELLPLAGMYELRPDVVAAYNQRMPNKPDVPMSVLAGTPLPFTCDQPGLSDGVVALPSAITGYGDTAQVKRVHTAITKGEDFTGFVLPRLTGSPFAGSGRLDASALATAAAPTEPAPQLLTTGTVDVPAGGTAELPFTVGQAGATGVSYVAPAGIRTTLTGPSGAVLASSADGEDSPLRTLRVENPAAGTYVLRLTSTGTAATVPVSAWVSGSPLALTISSSGYDTAGRATVTADLARSGAGLGGAAVTASLRQVDGQATGQITLTDEGEGTYAGRSARLTPGTYWLTVTAVVDGAPLSTLSTVEVGEATQPEDTTAPVVTATRPVPTGTAGWDRGPVTVTLTATDEDGGSGVAAIRYSVGTGAEQTVPGATAAATVSAQGATTVTYRAVDLAGNLSKPQTLTVKIDSVAPTAACSPSIARIWPPNHKLVPLTVSCTVTDGGSGKGALTLLTATSSEADDVRGDGDGATTGDLDGWVAGTPDLAGQVRAERAETGTGRTYTLTYRVADIAGNTVDVPVAIRVAQR